MLKRFTELYESIVNENELPPDVFYLYDTKVKKWWVKGKGYVGEFPEATQVHSIMINNLKNENVLALRDNNEAEIAKKSKTLEEIKKLEKEHSSIRSKLGETAYGNNEIDEVEEKKLRVEEKKLYNLIQKLYKSIRPN